MICMRHWSDSTAKYCREHRICMVKFCACMFRNFCMHTLKILVHASFDYVYVCVCVCARARAGAYWAAQFYGHM